MPDFEDFKDTGRGGVAQNGAGGADTSAAIVSDIFQRVGQLSGFMVVAYVAPVGGGTMPSARRAPRALQSISEQVAAAQKASATKTADLKGVKTPKTLYTAE